MSSATRARKEKYAARLIDYLATYKNILIVGVDNVGSNQMQKVRIALRGSGVVLMGKNTLMRKVIREQAATNPAFEGLLPLIYGNIGFIFTNSNLADLRKSILTNKVPAPAKSGTAAPSDVFIPAGPTGLDPGQTAFFQALNIATKIVKGAIEIVADVHLIKAGERVTSSHVALLTKMNIQPFTYGFKIDNVYENGTIYSAAVLDISEADLRAKFGNAVAKLAALSLAIGIPTAASIPHSFANAFKKLIAISLVTDIEFEAAKKFKEYLANPGAFAAAAPAAAAGAAKPAAAAKKETSEEEQDMGFSLFD